MRGVFSVYYYPLLCRTTTMHHITLHTNKGDIRLTLEHEKAPHTVANFITLAKNGFYDDILFHRVIEDFMIQTGCPQGTGTGGPGYQFGDEFHPTLRHNKPGILSMANSGPQTNGSQFFITHIETPWLDGKHSVFGSIIDDADMAVVNSIAQGDRINNITIVEEISFPENAAAFAAQIDEFIKNNPPKKVAKK